MPDKCEPRGGQWQEFWPEQPAGQAVAQSGRQPEQGSEDASDPVGDSDGVAVSQPD